MRALRVRGALHLKTAVTCVAANTLLMNRDWLDPFNDFEIIDVDAEEPFAANALRIGGSVLYSSSYPRTREKLIAQGIDVHSVDMSELEKAESGVTCSSVIYER